MYSANQVSRRGAKNGTYLASSTSDSDKNLLKRIKEVAEKSEENPARALDALQEALEIRRELKPKPNYTPFEKLTPRQKKSWFSLEKLYKNNVYTKEEAYMIFREQHQIEIPDELHK